MLNWRPRCCGYTATVAVWLCLVSLAHAYVDMAPTLAKVIGDAQRIAVIEVIEFNRAGNEIIFREVKVLKGKPSSRPLRHQVGSWKRVAMPQFIPQWAVPEARALCFSSRRTALVCVGQGWYQVQNAGNGWMKLSKNRPELPLAYFGSVSRLMEGIELMLAGKDAVLTVVAHGDDQEAASFDMALNRAHIPDLVRVQRIRANLQMPSRVLSASANPTYMVGTGSVDKTDLPELLEKLKSKDPLIRADAAEDLRRLGRRAHTALEALTPLLKDLDPRVRLAAAPALLRIDPDMTQALIPLSQGLASATPDVRCAAARAAARAGPAAQELVPTLARMLSEKEESVRMAALQAIALLGPSAAGAVQPVTALLGNPKLAIEAADTLGRIGPAAQPVPEQLIRMLSSKEKAMRWAAVRAMAQIGGEEAKPAVRYIMRALPRATEVEGYNMMIYLALLGPVASDAADTIRNTRIINPALPSATLWAISGGVDFPWREGRFSGGPALADEPEARDGARVGFHALIYRAYIRELGERLRPTARLLVDKIMTGTAGNVPPWGYEILCCAPDETVPILVSNLEHDSEVMRERAIMALGYMGPAAFNARKAVAAASSSGVSSEREKRLLTWCMREIGQE
jgi:HEAT repeat protein